MTLGIDQKNQIADTSHQNDLSSYGDWAHPRGQSLELSHPYGQDEEFGQP